MLDLLQWNKNNINKKWTKIPALIELQVGVMGIYEITQGVGAIRIKKAEVINLGHTEESMREFEFILELRDPTDCKQKSVVNENKPGDL